MLPPILAKLTSLVQKRRREERRQTRRMSPGQMVSCQVKFADNYTEVEARVDNISVRGIGILTSEAPIPQSTIHLILINAPHTYALKLEAKVMRCCSVVNGDYFVGCKFARMLTYDEMARFLV